MNSLKLLLVAAFLNFLSWIVLVPLWHYPDEQAHFAQVQDIAEIGSIPPYALDTSQEIAITEFLLDTKRTSNGNNKFTYHPEYKIEYSNTTNGPYEDLIKELPKETRTKLVKSESTFNPPLFYKLAGTVYDLKSGENIIDRVFAVRIFSAIIFLATIFVAYSIGKEIFSNNLFALTLAGATAFKPMLVFSSTGVLPDTLTNFLFSTVLLLSVLIVKNGPKLNLITLTIVTIILGIFTRQQFLISVVIVLIALAINLLINLKTYKKLLAQIFIFLLSLLALSFIFQPAKNLWKLKVSEVERFDVKTITGQKFISFSYWTVKNTLAQTLPWYWGIYKWLSLPLPPLAYQIINRLIIISAAGVVLGIINSIRHKIFSFQEISIIFFVGISLIYFMIFLVWDYQFFVSHGFSFGIQGRYYFPLAIAHLAVLIYGFRSLSKIFLEKLIDFVPITIAALFFLLNFVSLLTVATSYYDNGSFSNFLLQASQYKPAAFKGIGLVAILISATTTQLMFLAKIFQLSTKRSNI